MLCYGEFTFVMGASMADRIVMRLGGIVGGETTGTITGGAFTFSPDRAKQIRDTWKELADSYDKSISRARTMYQITPPAQDFASVSFTDIANTSGASYARFCQGRRDKCLREAQRYQDALDTYLGAEERTVIALGDAGTSADDGTPPPVV